MLSTADLPSAMHCRVGQFIRFTPITLLGGRCHLTVLRFVLCHDPASLCHQTSSQSAVRVYHPADLPSRAVST